MADKQKLLLFNQRVSAETFSDFEEQYRLIRIYCLTKNIPEPLKGEFADHIISLGIGRFDAAGFLASLNK